MGRGEIKIGELAAAINELVRLWTSTGESTDVSPTTGHEQGDSFSYGDPLIDRARRLTRSLREGNFGYSEVQSLQRSWMSPSQVQV